MVALVSGGKLAIGFIPNVEIVTTFFVVFTLVFGWRDAFISSMLFVLIEIAIWGFVPMWVVLYAIYWPLLVTLVYLVSMPFRKSGKYPHTSTEDIYDKSVPHKLSIINPQLSINTRVIIAAIAVGIAMTAVFGALSAIIDMIFMGGLGTGQFWEFVLFRYIAGTWFFVTHIVSNAILLPLLVPVLTKSLYRIARQTRTRNEANEK